MEPGSPHNWPTEMSAHVLYPPTIDRSMLQPNKKRISKNRAFLVLFFCDFRKVTSGQWWRL